jgi:hypothetical protein
MRSRKGQSLLEFGLIAAGVLVLAIPAMMVLGRNLNSLWMGMLSIPPPSAAPVVAKVPFEPPSPTPTPSGGGSGSTSPPSPSASSNLPAVLNAATITQMVQTAGVNGATDELANSLVNQAEKLLAEGQIDEAAYNNIIALANQGHRLADIESAIMSAAKAAGNGGGSGYDRSSAQFDGKTYSGPQLSALIGTSSTDVKSFQQLLNSVLATNTLDAATRESITQLSASILTIANASATSSEWMDMDGGGINVYDSFVDDLPSLIKDYSGQTNQNSNDICSTQSNTAACTK